MRAGPQDAAFHRLPRCQPLGRRVAVRSVHAQHRRVLGELAVSGRLALADVEGADHDLLRVVRIVDASGVAERLAGPEADGAADRQQHDQERERDRSDEGERDVPGREHEGDVDLHDLLHEPDEEAVERVAERDAEQPAGECERDALGSEDTPGVG